MSSETKRVLSEGNFNLRGWVSKIAPIVRTLGGIVEPSVCLHQDDAKVLGLLWNTVLDVLTFKVDLKSEVVFTRRGLLSKLTGLFDPQGLISPIMISGKIEIKELVIQNLDWDDAVSEETKFWWFDWIKSLKDLPRIKFPRCLLPLGVRNVENKLHLFCDASEHAFAAVAYVRSIDGDGNIAARMVCFKTRVSSKNPRLSQNLNNREQSLLPDWPPI